MISKLKIEMLFNLFNYDIVFKEDGVTILTGPNGYGKTTILKIIHAFSNQNVPFFLNLIFEKIEFSFTDGTNYSLIKENDTVTLFKNGEELGQSSKKHVTGLLEKISRTTPFQRLNDNKWIDKSIEEIVDLEFVLNKIAIDEPDISKKIKFPIPSTIKVYLIREQRLLRRIDKLRQRRFFAPDDYLNQFSETIQEYANELKSHILTTLSNYSQISQELDSSFPRRLFEQKNEVTEADFNTRFEKIKDIQKALTKYELSILHEDNNPTYKKENSKALLIYLEDSEKKLSVFEKLINRLDLFTNILNDRRFSFKRITIDKEFGFKIETTNDKKSLTLTELSSGEQQEVVMLYELLFKTSEDTLVLIDEPEISLHVSWQKEFLSDLKKVVKIQNINVAIATHSPQIINENWNLTIDLEELNNEKIS